MHKRSYLTSLFVVSILLLVLTMVATVAILLRLLFAPLVSRTLGLRRPRAPVEMPGVTLIGDRRADFNPIAFR